MFSARRLKLSAYLAVLVHVLILQITLVTEVPALGRAESADWRGLVFVDTADVPKSRSQEPVEDTRLISQDSFRKSDRMPGSADDRPASPESEADAPVDTSEPGTRTVERPDERTPGDMALYDEGRLAPRTVTGKGTTNEGPLMYNVKKHEYADYYKHIRDRIVVSWQTSYSHDLQRLLQRNHRATVLFRVDSDGSIRDLRPGPDQSDSLELVTKMMQVIKNAGPLDRFPEKIIEPYLNIRFDFYFF